MRELIKRLAVLLRALAATAILVLVWMAWHYGFNDFSSSTDLQMLGLLILAVGLVESGRLVSALHPDTPDLSGASLILLTLAVLFLDALGSFLALLPIVEPLLT